MKKLFIILCFLMTTLSFNASSATFILTDTANSVVGTGTNSVSTSTGASAPFNLGWSFTSSGAGLGLFSVAATPIPNLLSFVVNVYDNGGLNLIQSFAADTLDKVFRLSFLANTPLFIEVLSNDIADITLSLSVRAVPLPAAVWLFAPVLMSLMGFRTKRCI